MSKKEQTTELGVYADAENVLNGYTPVFEDECDVHGVSSTVAYELSEARRIVERIALYSGVQVAYDWCMSALKAIKDGAKI